MNIPSKTRTLELMRAHGIKTATIHFSGGNDEGYTEPPVFEMADDRDAPALPRAYDYIEYGSWNGPNHLKDGTPELAQLAVGLEQPVEDTYGSFAGEFYVDGDVIWDADAGTCVMEHDYETPSSEHLSTEF
jgi:hypothetical protein